MVVAIIALAFAISFIHKKIQTEEEKPKAVILSPEQRDMVLHSSNPNEKAVILNDKERSKVLGN